jgi:S1-C subfamily serine protease
MVKKVAPHSVAADAGIQVGDILLRVGDAGVNEPSDVKTSVAAVTAVTAGDVVPIKLMRKATLIWVDAQF